MDQLGTPPSAFYIAIIASLGLRDSLAFGCSGKAAFRRSTSGRASASLLVIKKSPNVVIFEGLGMGEYRG
jgi:hypothetical protein